MQRTRIKSKNSRVGNPHLWSQHSGGGGRRRPAKDIALTTESDTVSKQINGKPLDLQTRSSKDSRKLTH